MKKISVFLKDYMGKLYTFLHTKESYHKYKYSTSVQISADVNNVLKSMKRTAPRVISQRVVQKVH